MARKRTQINEGVVSGSASAAAAPVKKHRSARVTIGVQSSEPAPAVPTMRPDREEIALLAYSYWETRGYQGGSPEEDWLRAEQELTSK